LSCAHYVSVCLVSVVVRTMQAQCMYIQRSSLVGGRFSTRSMPPTSHRGTILAEPFLWPLTICWLVHISQIMVRFIIILKRAVLMNVLLCMLYILCTHIYFIFIYMYSVLCILYEFFNMCPSPYSQRRRLCVHASVWLVDLVR
jgi:hypothetical protein